MILSLIKKKCTKSILNLFKISLIKMIKLCLKLIVLNLFKTKIFLFFHLMIVLKLIYIYCIIYQNKIYILLLYIEYKFYPY